MTRVILVILTVFLCTNCFGQKVHYKVFVDSNVIKQFKCNDTKAYKIDGDKVIRRDGRYRLIDTKGLCIYVRRQYPIKGGFKYYGYFSLDPCSEVYRLNYHQLKKRVFTNKLPDAVRSYEDNEKYYKPSDKYAETFINEVYNDYLKSR